MVLKKVTETELVFPVFGKGFSYCFITFCNVLEEGKI